MVEYRDLYDANKQMTGKTFIKGEKIPNEYYNVIVVRVPNKGGQWALTGGHPKAGETSLEGIKAEVKEELGLNVDNDNIDLLTTITIDNHFIDLYYLEKDVDIKDIHIQREEVEDVKWTTKDEILKMIEEDEFYEGYKFLEYLKVTRAR